MIELRTNCGWKALVHKNLLCHYSKYYEAAIFGHFREANSDYFDLGLNKSCTEWFVKWLYSGKLSGPDAHPSTEELFRLYIFADEKDFLGLRRDVMTTLVQVGRDYLTYREVALATNSLPSSAPLYKFVVAWYINHWYPTKNDPCQQGQEYERLSKEFMHLVMCGLSERAEVLRHGEEPTCVCCHEPCRFHEHESYNEWHSSEFGNRFHARASTNLFYKTACLLLGNMKRADCPEELKPKPDQTPIP